MTVKEFLVEKGYELVEIGKDYSTYLGEYSNYAVTVNFENIILTSIEGEEIVLPKTIEKLNSTLKRLKEISYNE